MSSVQSEVVKLVVGALDEAWSELHELESVGFPVPDDVHDKLTERAVLLDTLKAAPNVGELRAIYRAQRARRRHVAVPEVRVPLTPGLMRGLDNLREELRRLAVLDPALLTVLRDTRVVWWVW